MAIVLADAGPAPAAGDSTSTAAPQSGDWFWRNHDLQPDRRQGLLSGSCEADFYVRHAAQSCCSGRGQQRSASGPCCKNSLRACFKQPATSRPTGPAGPGSIQFFLYLPLGLLTLIAIRIRKCSDRPDRARAGSVRAYSGTWADSSARVHDWSDVSARTEVPRLGSARHTTETSAEHHPYLAKRLCGQTRLAT